MSGAVPFKACERCAFFARDTRLRAVGGGAVPVVGDCRRHAPRSTEQNARAVWPGVSGTHWCGDFKHGAAS